MTLFILISDTIQASSQTPKFPIFFAGHRTPLHELNGENISPDSKYLGKKSCPDNGSVVTLISSRSGEQFRRRLSIYPLPTANHLGNVVVPTNLHVYRRPKLRGTDNAGRRKIHRRLPANAGNSVLASGLAGLILFKLSRQFLALVISARALGVTLCPRRERARRVCGRSRACNSFSRWVLVSVLYVFCALQIAKRRRLRDANFAYAVFFLDERANGFLFFFPTIARIA